MSRLTVKWIERGKDRKGKILSHTLIGLSKGAFTNYVDKKRSVFVVQKCQIFFNSYKVEYVNVGNNE